MFLPLFRLLRKAGCLIPICLLVVTLIALHAYNTKKDALDLDDAVLPLPSTRNEGTSNHRHLFHIYDLHSSLLERFKVIDLSSARRVQNRKDKYNFTCTVSSSVPSFKICLHEPEKDRFISAGLLSTGLWEPYITRAFQAALSRHPDATIIDVGANIGYYSFLSSAMGHKVIAIEPQEENVKRFVAGASANHWNDNIILLVNALADSHKNVSLSTNIDNQGGIRVIDTCEQTGWLFAHRKAQTNTTGCNVPTLTFDDLLYIVDARTAIIKIDIEGYECRALATASRFFAAINVPYVFMEWRQMRERQHMADSACRTEQIRTLSNFFSDRGYVPHEIRSGIQLNPYSAVNWIVGDIYWRNKRHDMLVQSL
ncbi:hypothetical protein BsWGS_06590 [Bradybaena similaris]